MTTTWSGEWIENALVGRHSQRGTSLNWIKIRQWPAGTKWQQKSDVPHKLRSPGPLVLMNNETSLATLAVAVHAASANLHHP